MSNLEIIEEALQLTPKDRFLVIDTLLKSLDKPDEELDKIWENESQKRLQAYKEGKLETSSFKEVFGS
jgi:putative addiction module component (TIGR02574 family)